MECPACGRQLQQMNVGDIVVDACKNGCGGVWFDNFELDKVDEQHEAAGESLLELERDTNVKVDRSATRTCPKCGGQKMVKHFASSKMQVEVDECPACGGLWLDPEELRHIRDQFADEEERRKAALALFDEEFGGDMAKMRAESEEKSERSRRIARMFRFVCPSYWIPGKQEWGAF